MNILLTLAFFGTVFIGIPIAFVLGLTTLIALLFTPGVPLHLIPQRMFTGMDSFPIMAVPFFIIAGELMNAAQITDSIVELSKLLVGRIRGSLGHVNVVASMFFAGISGSAVADASALGTILIPAMERTGYKKSYASAICAAAAVVGPIIPPSIPMVVLGSIANLSVGALFLGGLIPGVMIGIGLMIVHYFIARKRNYPKTKIEITFKSLAQTLLRAIIPLLMPLIILGGILGGIFTPTEAAAVAVVYAVFAGIFVMRTLSYKQLPRIFFRGLVVTSIILFVMGTANTFSWVLATQEIPQKVASYIFSITKDPYLILFLVNILLLIVGCVLEGTAAIILLTPILLPIAVQVGINPLHFALVVITNLMIGLLTPPLGLVLFVVCGISKLTLHELFKEVVPFLLLEIGVLFLVTYMPWTTLYIPKLFGLV